MPIRFKCPTCERMLSIARRKAGSQIVCPRCEEDVTVPDADLADEEDINVEPVEESGSSTKPIAIGAPPKAPTKPKQDKLFEDSDFEQLLDEKVKKASDDAAARKPEPPKLVPQPTTPPELIEDKGVLLSRGAAVVLGVLMLVLLALAFATGYLIGR